VGQHCDFVGSLGRNKASRALPFPLAWLLRSSRTKSREVLVLVAFSFALLALTCFYGKRLANLGRYSGTGGSRMEPEYGGGGETRGTPIRIATPRAGINTRTPITTGTNFQPEESPSQPCARSSGIRPLNGADGSRQTLPLRPRSQIRSRVWGGTGVGRFASVVLSSGR
jgi:hypothetical protein